MQTLRSIRLISCALAVGLIAGCASTEVTEQETTPAGMEPIAKPAMIHVYPFAASLADVPAWTAAAIRYPAPDVPQSEEEQELGRALGLQVAEDLVAEIQEMGLPALLASNTAHPMVDDVLITGYFEAVEQGSAAERVLLGFGSGNADLRTAVEGYQMTSLGPRLLGSGKVESGGSKTPGVVAPLVVLAATGNPIGLVATGTAKVVGEGIGKNEIDSAAKRTAEEIAKRLEVRFEELGWID